MEELTTFVCTSDEETREKLKKEGLIEIKNSNGIYTFLTNGKKNFNVDKQKIVFSKSLCI